MWPYKVVLRCQHDFAVMVLSEGSLLTTAPFIMVLQTSVPILSGDKGDCFLKSNTAYMYAAHIIIVMMMRTSTLPG